MSRLRLMMFEIAGLLIISFIPDILVSMVLKMEISQDGSLLSQRY